MNRPIASTDKPYRVTKVPVLVRFWEEDGVWNASAMDLSVAVFGDTFEEARRNFESAIKEHFELLCELKKMHATATRLLKAAEDRHFYDRIAPRQTFEKFIVDAQEPCLV